jgi:hypothetical protein
MKLTRQCMAAMSQSCPQKIFCLSVSLWDFSFPGSFSEQTCSY